MDNILENLNKEQHAAVVGALDNTLVLAGAGSGKTLVLVSRIAWLISTQNISTYEVLAVTFTNKAALEIKQRLSKILQAPIANMWVGTFHGLCHRLLRIHHREANLAEHFHILDSDDQARIIKRVINSLNLDIEKWPVKTAQSFINARKDDGIRARHIFQDANNDTKTLIKIYEAYEKACDASSVIDFAEIILRAHELLRDNKDLLMHYQQRFKAILVDEFQDTNTIQYAWIKLLASGGAFVMAVGDDDQSIYGWRGAKVENIAKFSKDFKNTNLIRLEQNYRSTATILDAANILINNNNSRIGKNLWTEGDKGDAISLFNAFNEIEEARFVVDMIEKEVRYGRKLKDIAILYRSNAQSRVIEQACLQENIAYKIYGGMRFYERSEVKDCLAYLRLIINRDDSEAFLRVVNFPTRGIGDKTIDMIRDIASYRDVSYWQVAVELITNDVLSSRAKSSLASFIDLINDMSEQSTGFGLDEQISLIITNSGLKEHFSKGKDNLALAKFQNLQELVSAAKEFCDSEITDIELSPLIAFLAHVSLDSGDKADDDNLSDYVHMMSIHAAKGLEFPMVFMVGMEEGLFPSKQSNMEPSKLEEERRLCYVGITRAMHKLILSYAEIRRQYGREEYHRPSRFIRELPLNLLDNLRVDKVVKQSNTFSDNVINSSGFELGMNVTHAKFGRGVIIAAEGSGANAKVQVKFQMHGLKWLVVAYANLMVDA